MEIKAQNLNAAVLVSFLLILAFAFDTAVSAPFDANSHRDHDLTGSNSRMALTYLGVSDGKAFFTDTASAVQWTAARASCNASVLELASIDSQAQVDFLRESIPTPNAIYFWTSARDSRLPSMLRWDATEVEPNVTIFESWTYDSASMLVCGAFNPSDGNFSMKACNTASYVLCQTTNI